MKNEGVAQKGSKIDRRSQATVSFGACWYRRGSVDSWAGAWLAQLASGMVFDISDRTKFSPFLGVLGALMVFVLVGSLDLCSSC